jgi:protein gp37
MASRTRARSGPKSAGKTAHKATHKATRKATRKAGTRTKRQSHRWSGRVTSHSHALALDKDIFTWKSPRRIAASLKRSAEHSRRRKSTPFQSAMSMLTFYINRAGDNLSAHQREVLEKAKDELRTQFGRQ